MNRRLGASGLVALLLAGCGTINTFPHDVYGGVQADVAWISWSSGASGGIRVAAVLLGIVDLPFSFVLDTLGLPVVLGYAMAHRVDSSWGPAERRVEPVICHLMEALPPAEERRDGVLVVLCIPTAAVSSTTGALAERAWHTAVREAAWCAKAVEGAPFEVLDSTGRLAPLEPWRAAPAIRWLRERRDRRRDGWRGGTRDAWPRVPGRPARPGLVAVVTAVTAPALLEEVLDEVDALALDAPRIVLVVSAGAPRFVGGDFEALLAIGARRRARIVFAEQVADGPAATWPEDDPTEGDE